jgi:hypothetical protein
MEGFSFRRALPVSELVGEGGSGAMEGAPQFGQKLELGDVGALQRQQSI